MVLYRCLSDGPALFSADRKTKKTPIAFFYIEFYGKMNDDCTLESINMIDFKTVHEYSLGGDLQSFKYNVDRKSMMAATTTLNIGRYRENE